MTGTSEMLVPIYEYQDTWRHIPEYHNLSADLRYGSKFEIQIRISRHGKKYLLVKMAELRHELYVTGAAVSASGVTGGLCDSDTG
jgi:hypothetical protein